MTTKTTQPTDSNGRPICDWCDQAVTDDAMTDARGYTVHETCFDDAHSDDDFASFDSMQCQCNDLGC